ncbi:MAG: putative Oxysterol-binding protein [Streblomastix strix]|uniref:Putative Oxysterol-binding protein n=1 Tax=Streblomastix strix TaxID=222440 RepID=A0A5J4WU19_9EUKA|nr:MAG: putative Oxysterol-binding protein [Streblomastix strix]
MSEVGASDTSSQQEGDEQQFVVDQEIVFDEKPKSIILSMVKQLKFGMDLSRISLPSFVLEPRSITERFTDFITHSQLLHDAIDKDDPVERLIGITGWYFSGWHPQSKGVKKPYNATLGEIFRCFWVHEDGTKTWYLAEQVSHHPPITALRFENKEKGWTIACSLYTKTKFLGNSVVCILEGQAHLKLINRKETYVFCMPSVYCRGILIGRLAVEVSGDTKIICKKTGLQSFMDFKSKGMIFGKYNQVVGKIVHLTGDKKKDEQAKGKKIVSLQGDWTQVLTVKDERKTGPRINNGEPFEAFNIKGIPILKKLVAKDEDQLEYESRRTWSGVSKGLYAKDIEQAADEKNKLEEQKRDEAKKRLDSGIGWRQRFFHFNPNTNRWIYNYTTEEEDYEDENTPVNVIKSDEEKEQEVDDSDDDDNKKQEEKEKELEELKELKNDAEIEPDDEAIKKISDLSKELVSVESKKNLEQLQKLKNEKEKRQELKEKQKLEKEKKKQEEKLQKEKEREIKEKEKQSKDKKQQSRPLPPPSQPNQSITSSPFSIGSATQPNIFASAQSTTSTSQTQQQQQQQIQQQGQSQSGVSSLSSGPGSVEITPFNAPDARNILPHPPKGQFTKKGKDVDVWVTDFPPPPNPSTLGQPWPSNTSVQVSSPSLKPTDEKLSLNEQEIESVSDLGATPSITPNAEKSEKSETQSKKDEENTASEAKQQKENDEQTPDKKDTEKQEEKSSE